MVLLARASGVTLANPLTDLTAQVTGPQLVEKTHALLNILGWQYPGCFLLIVPVLWWRRRGSVADYGFTRNGYAWGALLLAGLVTTRSPNCPRGHSRP